MNASTKKGPTMKSTMTRMWRMRRERERGGKPYESNRIIILILCQIVSRKEMLHNMHEERKKERRKEEAISLCTADTARRKRRLQGCVSQRICTEFKCLPPALPCLAQRVLRGGFCAPSGAACGAKCRIDIS